MKFSRLKKALITSLGAKVNAYACSIMLIAFAGVFARFYADSGSLAFFDDDFFYYLKIARNVAAGYGSTFDGIHKTNGYHPLWLILLCCLSKVLSPRGILIAVSCLICISTVATYKLARSVFKQCGSGNAVAVVCATAVSFSSLYLSRGGMEVVLTLPMAMAFCAYRLRPRCAWTKSNALVYGLLASIVVLSRLDSVLFVGMAFVLEFVLNGPAAPQNRIRLCIAFATAMLPITAYLTINNYLFQLPVPVSSLAKQLRIHHGLTSMPLRSVIYLLPFYMRLLIVLPGLTTLVLAAGKLACRGWGRLPVRGRPIAVGLMLFPLMHIFVLSMLSDWALWPWYLYSQILGELGSFMILLSGPAGTRLVSRRLIYTVAISVSLLVLGFAAHEFYESHRPGDPMYAIYGAALEITQFARTHPGRYAMGDRAGTVGYLLPEPLLQTEGLVMDASYLDNIRKERDLIAVLSAYGVEYYITTGTKADSGCYNLREPAQAGRDSHSMLGKVCQKPIYTFSISGVVTNVFDLRTPACIQQHCVS